MCTVPIPALVFGLISVLPSIALAQRPAPARPPRPVASTAPTTTPTAAPAPTVTAGGGPADVGIGGVSWVVIDAPGIGRMHAAVARPAGPGPFPAVIVLHGSEGFAVEDVELAKALAGGGFVGVAPCWFTGGTGAGSRPVTPIACADAPAMLEPGSPDTERRLDALVRAVRTLPDVRGDRLGLVGPSSGGAIFTYLLGGGHVQAAVVSASGSPPQAGTGAHRGKVTTPLLVLPGLLDRDPVTHEDALSRVLAFLSAVLLG